MHHWAQTTFQVAKKMPKDLASPLVLMAEPQKGGYLPKVGAHTGLVKGVWLSKESECASETPRCPIPKDTKGLLSWSLSPFLLTHPS